VHRHRPYVVSWVIYHDILLRLQGEFMNAIRSCFSTEPRLGIGRCGERSCMGGTETGEGECEQGIGGTPRKKMGGKGEAGDGG
jgi:hypothetical protein